MQEKWSLQVCSGASPRQEKDCHLSLKSNRKQAISIVIKKPSDLHINKKFKSVNHVIAPSLRNDK